MEAVRAQGFRNLSDGLVELGPRLNVLQGRNGQGKTNLLEALVLVAGHRSFRGARYEDMVQDGCADFRIEARLTGSDGCRHLIDQRWSRRGKRVRLDDTPVRRSSVLVDLLPVIFFGPDDLAIVKGSPGGRRSFMDEGAVLCQPSCIDAFRRFHEVLKQRNGALRLVADHGGDRRVLRAYTRALISASTSVDLARADFVGDFAPIFERTSSEVSEGRYRAELELSPSDLLKGVEGGQGSFSAAETEAPDALVDALDARDLPIGTTIRGPHRADLAIRIDGHLAQARASQGQSRLIAIALKLALLRMVADRRSCEPVLLLDDVSSELDRDRSRLLTTYLRAQGGQVVATTTDAASVGLVGPDLDLFEVEQGSITAVDRDQGKEVLA